MANYSLQINSRFRPMTFEELVKPFSMYREEYRALEDAISNLETEASVWENRINKETDTKAALQYLKYADDLRARAYTLATQGLTPGSRRAMLDMKRRYASEITPIAEAYTTRLKLAEELRKLLANHPEAALRFSTDYSIASLDDLLNNPQASYETLSGSAIADRTAKIASNYAKAVILDPTFEHVLGSLYWQVKQQLGYTPMLIMAEAINNPNDPNIPKELREIRNYIHDAVRNNKAYNKDFVDAYISEGMSSAIGTAKYDYLADKVTLANGTGGGIPPMLSTPEFNLTLRFNKAKREASIRDYDFFKLKHYFEEDSEGNIRITAEGRKHLSKGSKTDIGANVAGREGRLMGTAAAIEGTDSKFYSFIKRISASGDDVDLTKFDDFLLGKMIKGFLNEIEASGNYAKYINEGKLPIEGETIMRSENKIKVKDELTWTDAAFSGAGNLGLLLVEYNDLTGKYESTGTYLTKELLKDYKVKFRYGSSAGRILEMHDSEGHVIQVKLPVINPAREAAEDLSYNNITILENEAAEVLKMYNLAVEQNKVEEAAIAYSRYLELTNQIRLNWANANANSVLAVLEYGSSGQTYGWSKGNINLDFANQGYYYRNK